MSTGGALITLLVEWKRASHLHVYTVVLHTLLLFVLLALCSWCCTVVMRVCSPFMELVVVIVYVGVLVVVLDVVVFFFEICSAECATSVGSRCNESPPSRPQVLSQVA